MSLRFSLSLCSFVFNLRYDTIRYRRGNRLIAQSFDSLVTELRKELREADSFARDHLP